MSVSSVSNSSSTSVWWEEYLEKQKKLQQQAASEAVKTEKNLSVAAEEENGETKSTKVSFSSVKTVGPSGMSGGTGASIKWIEALAE